MEHTLKPMENVFINMVTKLVDTIHKTSSGVETQQDILKKLHQHLDKAKRHEMQFYEAEVYNALAIYYIRYDASSDDVLEYLNLGRDLAEKVNSTELLMRILNAIGGIWMIKHDYEKALPVYQNIIDFSTTTSTPSLYTTFAYLNLVGNYARTGQWDLVQSDLDALDEVITQLPVTPNNRQNYGRIIYYAYIIKIQTALALGNDKSALESLKLVKELARQLDATDADRYLIPLDGLYEVIVEDNVEPFNIWFENVVSNQTLTILDASILASVLRKRDQISLARKLANTILALAPDATIRQNLKQDLENVGIIIE